MASTSPISAANISPKTPWGWLGQGSSGDRVELGVIVGRRRAGVRVIAACAVWSIVALGVSVGGLAVEVGRWVGIAMVGDEVGREVAVTN